MDRDQKPAIPVTATSARRIERVGGVRSISSDQLMAGQRVVLIRHGNEEYRLQITGAGKLILTK